MKEQIGKIILDKKHYPGMDLYCDGTIEDEILDIVKNNAPGDYRRIIEEKASWPIFYHLSSLRENIVDWLPIGKDAKVLEVGSGCGAITGALSRKAGSVTCIDLSRKRSLINAYRHQDRDNIYIHVGNFKDVEKDLENDYDYVMLIGVFEYGRGYMGSETPYEDFMNILKKHLKPGGRMVIAIENKLGLKYFAGCREDHSGRLFDSIEDYPGGEGSARTFSKEGLTKILNHCGMEQYSFYYPYPDYKFPNTIFSDQKLPKPGELYQNIRNFDRDRVLLFDEQKAFDMVIREGMFPQYSNSFLVITGPETGTEYVKYSNDRAPQFAIRTDIRLSEGIVEKLPIGESAGTHVDNMKVQSKRLEKVYEGTGLLFNRIMDSGEGMAFEYLKGVTLEEILDDCLAQNDRQGFVRLVDRFRDILKAGSQGVRALEASGQTAVADFDLIFQNIMVDGDKWTVIDYEWTFERNISEEFMFRRALYCYFADRTNREQAKTWLVEHYAGETLFEGEKWQEVLKAEQEFQRYVQGDFMAVSEIRHAIGRPVYSLDYLLNAVGACDNKIQIYEDRGNGFSEGESYFVECSFRVGEEYRFEIPLTHDLKNVRIDPCNRPCIVTVKQVLLGEKDITEALVKTGKNGFRSHSGIRLSDNSFFFADNDPHFAWRMEPYVKKDAAKNDGGNNRAGSAEVLHVHIRMEFISPESAQSLMAGFGLKGKLSVRSGR